MSRCYAFPPPGYEKKAILGDTDSLTKEKHKEKKHKKDKDKEKREGKEKKKDKERSDRKHNEKKNRKEKQKERKDKDRDKEKEKTSVEKNIVGPLKSLSDENLGSSCPQNGDSRDCKFLLELGKRIIDEGGARENRMFQSTSVTYQKNGELPGRVVEINIGNSTEGKELYKNRREGDRHVNGYEKKIEANGVANSFIQNLSGMDRIGVGVAGPVDKDDNKLVEEKKKHKHKDSESRGDRQKDKDHAKKSKSKDKGRTKKEKEGKTKEKEPGKDKPTLRESSKNVLQSHNNIPSYLLKESDKSSTYKLNLGKRKEPERNGFLHDDSIRPNKLPKSISSSHQLVENGRKLEPCKAGLHVAFERQAAANNHKVEGKVFFSHQILQNGKKLDPNPTAIQPGSERPKAANSSKTAKDVRINGIVEAQQLHACSREPLCPPAQAKVKVEAFAKLPLMQNGRKLDPNPTAIQSGSERPKATNSSKTAKDVRINGLIEAQQLNACSREPLCPPAQTKVKVEASAKLPHLQNGQKFYPNPTAIQSGSERPKAANSSMIAKDVRINGLTEARQQNACSRKPLSPPAQAEEKIEASAKLPHPDSKYLSQILSIPKILYWSDFDDQEWLFRSNELHEEDKKMGSFELDGTSQVWAKALRIDSMDVTALPYVVPF